MVVIKKYGTSWCSHCMALNSQLKETPLKYEVQSFDVDDMEDADIDALNIRTIPVCIIYKDNEEVTRFIDDYTPEDINKYLEENNL